MTLNEIIERLEEYRDELGGGTAGAVDGGLFQLYRHLCAALGRG